MQEPLSFGLWMKERRRVLGLTQQEMAARAACSLSSLRKIEAGVLMPSRELALLLAAAVGVPLEEQEAFVAYARDERRAISTPALMKTTAFPPDRAPLAAPSPTRSPAPLHRTSLPPQVTSFFGREAEIAAVQQMLANPACNLLTLVGPGGIGKTRLAIAVAQTISESGSSISDFEDGSLSNPKSKTTGLQFNDGIYFVSFAGVTSPESIATTIAHALALSFADTTDPQTQLLTFLREKQILLVLDNLEHLLAGVDLLVAILHEAPSVKMIVTSRERLELQSEWVFDLQALAEPVAVTLFVERAQRVQHQFTLTPTHQAAVERICRLVGGMPLALEIAANWVHALSLHEIADEIGRNLDFLSATGRDLPARQRSMRATFDYSWQLLSEQERKVLRRLAVFRGGFQREAATAVAQGTLPVLANLIAKSLLRRNAEGRFDIHELVRQFAGEHLSRDPVEEDQTRHAHAAYYVELAETTALALKGADHGNWVSELEREEDNIEAALHWTLVDPHRPQRASPGAEDADVLMGVRLATALGSFWITTGHLTKGLYWLYQALRKGQNLPEALRAQLFYALGATLYAQGNFQQSEPLFEESVALYRTLGHQQGLAESYFALGRLHNRQRNYETAQQLLNQSLACAQAVDDLYQVAYTLNLLVNTSMGQQAYEQARHAAPQALESARASNNRTLLTYSLTILGELARVLEEYAQAEAYYQEGITLAQELGQRLRTMWLYHNLGHVALHQRDAARARHCFLESLRLGRQLPNHENVAMCLLGLGGVASALRMPAQAARLFGAGQALLYQLQSHLDPVEEVEYKRNVAATLDQLSVEEYAQHAQAGHLLSPEEAIEIALSI